MHALVDETGALKMANCASGIRTAFVVGVGYSDELRMLGKWSLQWLKRQKTEEFRSKASPGF